MLQQVKKMSPYSLMWLFIVICCLSPPCKVICKIGEIQSLLKPQIQTNIH